MAEHDESCECGLPNGAIITRELRIMEYLDPRDGELYKVDLSHDGSTNELSVGAILELAEWAKAMAVAPMVADIVQQMMFGDDEDGEDVEVP